MVNEVIQGGVTSYARINASLFVIGMFNAGVTVIANLGAPFPRICGGAYGGPVLGGLVSKGAIIVGGAIGIVTLRDPFLTVRNDVFVKVNVVGIVEAHRVITGGTKSIYLPGGSMPKTRIDSTTGVQFTSEDGGTTGDGELQAVSVAFIRDVTDKLLSIKARATEMSDAIAEMLKDPTVSGAQAVTDVLDAVKDELPEAPTVLRYADLPRMLAEVQLPESLGFSVATLQSMDAKVLMGLIKQQGNKRINTMTARYRERLKSKSSWQVVKFADIFMRDLKRIALTDEKLQKAKSYSSIAKIKSSLEHANTAYQSFDKAVDGFTQDRLIPKGMDSKVQDLMSALMDGEERITAWRQQMIVRQ